MDAAEEQGQTAVLELREGFEKQVRRDRLRNAYRIRDHGNGTAAPEALVIIGFGLCQSVEARSMLQVGAFH